MIENTNTYWNDDQFGGTATGESLFLGHGRFHEPLGVASVHPLTGPHYCGLVQKGTFVCLSATSLMMQNDEGRVEWL